MSVLTNTRSKSSLPVLELYANIPCNYAGCTDVDAPGFCGGSTTFGKPFKCVKVIFLSELTTLAWLRFLNCTILLNSYWPIATQLVDSFARLHEAVLLFPWPDLHIVYYVAKQAGTPCGKGILFFKPYILYLPTSGLACNCPSLLIEVCRTIFRVSCNSRSQSLWVNSQQLIRESKLSYLKQ